MLVLDPQVLEITIDPVADTIVFGESIQLAATVTVQDGASEDVTWSSADPNIALVLQDGTVTGQTTAGTVIITATSDFDGTQTASSTILVNEAAAVLGVQINPVFASTVVGETVQLTAVVTAVGGANESVTWSSLNESRAMVDANGLVTGVSSGLVIITATSVFDNTEIGTSTINVELAPEVLEVRITPAVDTVNVGSTISLTENVTAVGGASESVTWSSLNESRATVDANGIVSGVSRGTVTITTTSVFDNTVTGAATVVVLDLEPTVLNPIDNTRQTEGYNRLTVDLSSVFTDANGDALTFTAESSNIELATVSVSGNTLTLTEVSGTGQSTITVTADDGNGGTVDDDFILTVDFPFSIANEGLLAGFSIEETISEQNIISLSGEGFASSNLIFAGGFNSSNASGLLYESGGTTNGTTIGLSNNAFIVSAGGGNNIDAQVTGLSPNRNYVYIVQILPGDRIDIWLQEGIAISSITGVADATGMITATNLDGGDESGYLTTGDVVQFALPDFVGNATEILLFVNQLNLVPQAPTVANSIADMSQFEGYNSFTVELSSVFTDSNGDVLTFTAESGNPGLATVTITILLDSRTILTVTEGSGIGTTTITVTVNDGNGGIVSDDFTLESKFAVYGYRLSSSTPNSGSNIIFNLSEGDILDGDSTTDLLTGVTPTGAPVGLAGTSFANFNDEEDNQSVSGLYHSGQTSNNKMLQVLGSQPLDFPRDIIRIRIVGRDDFQDRNNTIVVTLLDAEGNAIGTPSNATSGFVDNNTAHDGFIVDFDATTGEVLRQPIIFDLNDPLPSISPQPPTVVSEIPDIRQFEGYNNFSVDINSVFADANGDILTFTVTSSNNTLVDVAFVAPGIILALELNRGTIGSSIITVTADDGNGGTVSDEFILTVLDPDSRLAVYGYRLSSSTPNSGGNIILNLSEGDILDGFFGSSTTDLLAGVTPTGSRNEGSGTSFTNFNDEEDDQTLGGLYHSAQTSSDKMIQVFGTRRLGFPSDVITIRVVGRVNFEGRNNTIVVTLLDAEGNAIGTPSNATSGFVNNNAAHDGFTVSFNAITGSVLSQPTIFGL